MSQPSPLKDFAVGGPRPGEGTGWTLLRHGWPALLLFAAFAWGFYVETVGGDGARPESLYALSGGAFADGRWWTLLTHPFVDLGMAGGILICAVLVAALTVTATPDPGWMGGWRTLAMFFAAAWAGALAQLSLAPAAPVSGPWIAVLGLAAYYVVSRRWASTLGVPRATSGSDDDGKTWAGAQAMSWLYIWLLLLVFAPQWGWLPPILSGQGAMIIMIASALVVGGAIAIYAIVSLGGQVGRKLARFAILATAVLGLLAIAYGVGHDLLEHRKVLLALPWAGYAVGPVAGLAAGIAAGQLERRGTREP